MPAQLETRQRQILAHLAEQGRLSVEELAQMLGISAITVRRDLAALAELGEVKRTHGGAELAETMSGRRIKGRHFEQARLVRPKHKARIAEAAASLVSDGQTIIVGNGTTTQHMALHLASRSVQVITYSLPLIVALQNTQCDVFVPGGHLYPAQGALLMADDDLMPDLSATHFFFSAHSIDISGSREIDPLLISVERRMAARSQKRVALVDSSKFEDSSGHLSIGMNLIDEVITDDAVTEPIETALRAKGVRVTKVSVDEM